MFFFILERRQLIFFIKKNFENKKKIEKMLGLLKFLRIRNPLGLMNISHLLNFKFETIRKSQKQQRLVFVTFAILAKK